MEEKMYSAVGGLIGITEGNSQCRAQQCVSFGTINLQYRHTYAVSRTVKTHCTTIPYQWNIQNAAGFINIEAKKIYYLYTM